MTVQPFSATAQVKSLTGSAAAPGITFSGDVDSGLFSPGANQVGIATGGTQRLLIGTDGTISLANNISVPLGSASAPSIYPGTDTNTGIYSPGADQVAISTNGTQRATIDSSGRLLIGTSTTQGNSLFQVQGNANASNDVADLLLWRNNAPFGFIDGTVGARIQLGASPSSGVFGVGAQIAMEGDATWGGGDYPGRLVFSTVADGSSSLTARMTIKNDGKVGLGTSSPATNLDIRGTSSAQLRIGSTGNALSNNTEIGTLEFFNSDGNQNNIAAYVRAIRGAGFGSGGLLAFGVSTTGSTAGAVTEALRITSAGNVGIGTTSPGNPLHVSGTGVVCQLASSNNNNVINIKGNGATNGAWLGTTSSDDFIIANGASGTERARIDSSGRLLVGTSSASSAGTFAQYGLIKIQGNSASSGSVAILNIARGEAATSITSGKDLGAISFTDSSGNEFGTIICTADANAGSGDYPGRLVFSTTADGASTPTERLRITSAGVLQVADAGNISVGTTTGTKIGTATTQKLGFYNATPVVQPTAVADATDAASVITQLNALLTRMRNLGLIAT